MRLLAHRPVLFALVLAWTAASLTSLALLVVDGPDSLPFGVSFAVAMSLAGLMFLGFQRRRYR
jgi:hypothetical protein